MVAAAVAIILPYGVPAIDVNGAIVVGGVLLIGSALTHEVFARQEEEGRIADALQSLRLEQDEAMREMAAAREQVSGLQHGLERALAGGGMKGGGHDVDSVIAEVKVLQSLVERLSDRTTIETGDAAPEDAAETGAAEVGDPAPGDAPPPAALPVPLNGTRGVPAALPVAAGPAAAGILDDARILDIVRDGLQSNRIDLVLQPVVSLPQRRLKFYEAFTRIRDADGAVLMPQQYIAIAEREGLITAIDNMLLFRCVQLVRKSQRLNQNIGFFCNFSAHSLTDGHFFDNFVEFMRDNRALAPNLIFEFPQSAIVNRDAEMEAQLKHLASLGFRFSMDQVASLNLDYDDLMAQHFKYIKVEAGTLLAELISPTTGIAIEDIKRVFDRHGMDLIVEKIETEPALIELLDFRIDFGQGYLFGEPRLSHAE
jgi:cyclic-di-GMP phosphodiesterase TipF (flagellum assembly factor)